MIKLIGCILIISSCYLTGSFKASIYKSRRLQLEDIIETIRVLDIEIQYNKDSLYKTLRKVSKRSNLWFSDVIKHVSVQLESEIDIENAFNDALSKNKEHCFIKNDDLVIVNDLFSGLGKSDIAGQKKLITPTIRRLEEALKDAKNEENRLGKMYKALGLAAGVLISILII